MHRYAPDAYVEKLFYSVNSYSVVDYIDPTKNSTVDYMTYGMADEFLDNIVNGMTGDFLI